MSGRHGVKGTGLFPARGRGYITGCVLLALLVAGALFLPGASLAFQDGLREKETKYASRAGLDYDSLNLEYDMELVSRISDFAKGVSEGENFLAMSPEYTGKPDAETILSMMSYQDIMQFLPSSYYPADFVFGLEYEVKEQTPYVIYKENMNGIAFLCQYLALKFEDGTEIEMLVDDKDYTVYYMSVFLNNQTIKMTDHRYADMEEYELYDYYTYLYSFFCSYYMAQPDTEPVSYEEPYDSIIVVDGKAGENVSAIESAFAVQDDRLTGRLMYGKNALNLDIKMAKEEDGFTMSMVLREVWELLPLD